MPVEWWQTAADTVAIGPFGGDPMRNVQVELIRMEVKYCENCGGLWCRRTGDTRVYCPTCRHQNLSRDSRKMNGITTK